MLSCELNWEDQYPVIKADCFKVLFETSNFNPYTVLNPGTYRINTINAFYMLYYEGPNFVNTDSLKSTILVPD